MRQADTLGLCFEKPPQKNPSQLVRVRIHQFEKSCLPELTQFFAARNISWACVTLPSGVTHRASVVESVLSQVGQGWKSSAFTRRKDPQRTRPRPPWKQTKCFALAGFLSRTKGSPQLGELGKPFGKVVDCPIAQVKELQRQTSRQLRRNQLQVVAACIKMRQGNHAADAGPKILLGSAADQSAYFRVGFHGRG